MELRQSEAEEAWQELVQEVPGEPDEVLLHESPLEPTSVHADVFELVQDILVDCPFDTSVGEATMLAEGGARLQDAEPAVHEDDGGVHVVTSLSVQELLI